VATSARVAVFCGAKLPSGKKTSPNRQVISGHFLTFPNEAFPPVDSVWAFGYNFNEVIFVTVINIETHNPLAALLDKGEGFLIAMGGKPVAKVMPYAATNQETNP